MHDERGAARDIATVVKRYSNAARARHLYHPVRGGIMVTATPWQRVQALYYMSFQASARHVALVQLKSGAAWVGVVAVSSGRCHLSLDALLPGRHQSPDNSTRACTSATRVVLGHCIGGINGITERLRESVAAIVLAHTITNIAPGAPENGHQPRERCRGAAT